MKSKITFLFIIASTIASTVFAQQSKTIKVLDATIKDAVVANAEVYIQKNGAQTILGTTNQNGEMLADGISQNNENTLIIIKKPGYSTLVVKCPCLGYTYALSPSMKSNQDIRVVLSWGAEPMDIDLHALMETNGSEVGHVYYNNKQIGNTSLDVDDRDGYGPETITIRGGISKKFGFVVRDYTNKTDRNYELSKSDARVFLYRGDSLIKTFYVPKNREGNLWKVFAMDQNELASPKEEFTFEAYFNPGSSQNDAATAESMQEEYNNYDEIPFLNDGEKAFREKRYEASLDLYRKALSVAPADKHSLIYNNMALSYLRMAKYDNCVFYSNKALTSNTSATGQTAAASYYNMGLAYEKLKKYRDAAQAFQKAGNVYEDNTVYKNALKRVRKLLK